MLSFLSLALMFVWTTWIFIALSQAKDLNEEKIKHLSTWLIPVVLGTCGLVSYYLPHPAQPDMPSPIIRAIHYSGIALLFVFLIFGALCQIEAWRIIKKQG